MPNIPSHLPQLIMQQLAHHHHNSSSTLANTLDSSPIYSRNYKTNKIKVEDLQSIDFKESSTLINFDMNQSAELISIQDYNSPALAKKSILANKQFMYLVNNDSLNDQSFELEDFIEKK